jgi:hypothetical protein
LITEIGDLLGTRGRVEGLRDHSEVPTILQIGPKHFIKGSQEVAGIRRGAEVRDCQGSALGLFVDDARKVVLLAKQGGQDRGGGQECDSSHKM